MWIIIKLTKIEFASSFAFLKTFLFVQSFPEVVCWLAQAFTSALKLQTNRLNWNYARQAWRLPIYNVTLNTVKLNIQSICSWTRDLLGKCVDHLMDTFLISVQGCEFNCSGQINYLFVKKNWRANRHSGFEYLNVFGLIAFIWVKKINWVARVAAFQILFLVQSRENKLTNCQNWVKKR